MIKSTSTPEQPGVLYVYRCVACGHRGDRHFPDDSHDGEAATCDACGDSVMLEWDGGVRLEVGRNRLDDLSVYPGPRGNPVDRPGMPRRAGRHLYWYIGRFEHRPGVSGPVRAEGHPTFRTKRAANEYLNDLRKPSNPKEHE